MVPDDIVRMLSCCAHTVADLWLLTKGATATRRGVVPRRSERTLDVWPIVPPPASPGRGLASHAIFLPLLCSIV